MFYKECMALIATPISDQNILDDIDEKVDVENISFVDEFQHDFLCTEFVEMIIFVHRLLLLINYK